MYKNLNASSYYINYRILTLSRSYLVGIVTFRIILGLKRKSYLLSRVLPFQKRTRQILSLRIKQAQDSFFYNTRYKILIQARPIIKPSYSSNYIITTSLYSSVLAISYRPKCILKRVQKLPFTTPSIQNRRSLVGSLSSSSTAFSSLLRIVIVLQSLLELDIIDYTIFALVYLLVQ